MGGLRASVLPQWSDLLLIPYDKALARGRVQQVGAVGDEVGGHEGLSGDEVLGHGVGAGLDEDPLCEQVQ